jgi:hypothetical protein
MRRFDAPAFAAFGGFGEAGFGEARADSARRGVLRQLSAASGGGGPGPGRLPRCCRRSRGARVLANNRVTVRLKKKGELLQVFVGQAKVAEYEKGIPASLQFDALSFDPSGNAAADKMFIGNVRIATN